MSWASPGLSPIKAAEGRPPTGHWASAMLEQLEEHFWVILQTYLFMSDVGWACGSRWGCCCSTCLLDQALEHLPVL